jgi:hypothetical protein
VDPVPPSPESQEDEVDRKDDEISVAPGSQERVFLDEEESDHLTDSRNPVAEREPLLIMGGLVLGRLMPID